MVKNNLNDMPLSELVLRKYERPYNISKRMIVKKFCLSVGLLQPGDSRDIIVDIFYILLENKNRYISSSEIQDKVIRKRNDLNLAEHGVASSNIRRQLKRLRDIFLIEKVKNKYRIFENLSISEIYSEKIVKYVFANINSRVKEYAEELDRI